MVDEREDDTGMKRGWIRDTDSKYVRMAKMGGRKGEKLYLILLLLR